MLQSEFESRVGMSISAEEYRAVEEVYMHSDLDKDEFCKQWVKMNRSRVNAVKAEAKKKAETEALNEKLHKIFNSLRYDDIDLADNKLSDRQKDLLSKVGIEMQGQRWYEPFPHFKTVMDVRYEIGTFLKIY